MLLTNSLLAFGPLMEWFELNILVKLLFVESIIIVKLTNSMSMESEKFFSQKSIEGHILMKIKIRHFYLSVIRYIAMFTLFYAALNTFMFSNTLIMTFIYLLDFF
jgi:hypothetical protein